MESIQHKLSSDYILNICFSPRFSYIDGPSFSQYKPLQNIHFWNVGNMQFFFQELHSHIDKNSGKKFEDMFLVKIANKGTSLSISVDDRQGAHLMLLKIDENYNAIAFAKSRSGCVFEV